MTVFLLMSLINLALAIALASLSIYKLKHIHNQLMNQLISSTVFIGFALAVLHAIAAVSHKGYPVTDVISGAWRIADMLVIIILIRYVSSAKD